MKMPKVCENHHADVNSDQHDGFITYKIKRVSDFKKTDFYVTPCGDAILATKVFNQNLLQIPKPDVANDLQHIK